MPTLGGQVMQINELMKMEVGRTGYMVIALLITVGLLLMAYRIFAPLPASTVMHQGGMDGMMEYENQRRFSPRGRIYIRESKDGKYKYLE
jgi:hypothetical protein